MRIIDVNMEAEYLEQAIAYFQDKWGDENSNPVYRDSLTRASGREIAIPKWYLLCEGDTIIGCCGMIMNDFISCSDLYPWLCALYIEESHRGKKLGQVLVSHVKEVAGALGFEQLYLCTDHVGYYEKMGFTYIADGYHPWGEVSRVYEITTKKTA